jgi:hypothetical protein
VGQEGRKGEQKRTYRSRRWRSPPRACTCRQKWCSRRRTLSKRNKEQAILQT